MNNQLVEQIAEMVKVDQEARFRIFGMMQEKGTKKKEKEAGFQEIKNFDTEHNKKIRKIIAEFGYPKQDLIGKGGMKNFWLLVQHQDFDLDLQEKCLDNCDFERQQKAYLTDRVRVNQGRKQIYGTQFDRPIEDEENVDKRRKEAGLEPLSEYLKKKKK